MTIKSIVIKSLICSAVALATVGSAVATSAFAEPSLSVVTCPALEGYPDCRPDARALWLRAEQQDANFKRGSAPKGKRADNGGFRLACLKDRFGRCVD